MSYVIRYAAGTPLAERFGTFIFRPQKTPTFPTREAAEQVRDACPNAAQMEVVDLEESGH